MNYLLAPLHTHFDLERVSKHPLGRFEIVPADEDAAESDEGLMDIRTPFVADRQAAEPMEPRDRPFDHPPQNAEAAPVRRAAAREDGDDPLRVQSVAMRLGVVAAIALEHVGPAPGTSAPAADRRKRGDERVELGDVVDIRGGHLRDERDAACVGNEMVFGTRPAAIGWVRSSFSPAHRADRRTVDDGPAVVEPAAAPEFGEQRLVQPLPHPSALPVDQAAPARAPGSASHPAWQHLPGNPRSPHEQDARQDRAVGNPRTPVAVPSSATAHGNERRQTLPDRVVDQVS